MPKRFTDSEKFRDTWYRKLTPVQKCLWEYLLSECSLAGIIEYDIEAASFHINAKVKEEDYLALSKHIHYLPDGKLFMPSFIRYQQKTLNKQNKAHNSIFHELKKYNIDESLEIPSSLSPSQGATKGLLSPPSKGKGIGIGIGNNTREAKNSRGTRLPPDWFLEQELGDWAVKTYHITPQEVVEQEARFKDYWLSLAGQKAVKKDWPAVWRNWIRNYVERKKT